MPDEFEPVDPVYGMVRIQVAQGCTGLWQIGRHSHQMPDSAPEYDSFYVEYASARLDAWVLWRTVLLVLRIRGPVSLAEIPRWACPQPRDTQVPQLAGERSI
jgi:hypothetical protein